MRQTLLCHHVASGKTWVMWPWSKAAYFLKGPKKLLLSEPAIVATPSCSQLPGDFTLAKRCFSEAKDTSISKCSCCFRFHSFYQIWCCQVSQVQSCWFQDLGALFLLYTSVGDAEGVLNTGKLAEASPLDHLILPYITYLRYLVLFLNYKCTSPLLRSLCVCLAMSVDSLSGKQHWQHCSALLLVAGRNQACLGGPAICEARPDQFQCVNEHVSGADQF